MPTWLVTGCSSGFGASFVQQLRAAGDNVVATGRNADTKLAFLKQPGVTVIDMDVTEDPAVIDKKVQQAWDAYPGGIDVVVNNAGFILSGAIEELT
jgi:NAD(P)-dependent dehydrogenase (short-subunit alcohol dehydrogenase family)